MGGEGRGHWACRPVFKRQPLPMLGYQWANRDSNALLHGEMDSLNGLRRLTSPGGRPGGGAPAT